MSGLSEMPHGIVTAANQKLYGELGDDARVVADALIAQPDFAASVANFARAKLRLRASLRLAREIMRSNFFGPKEIRTALGIAYGEQERFELEIIPFLPSTLERCKDTHVLIAVFGLSLIELRECVREEKLFGGLEWPESNPIVSSKGKATWHLVRKACVRNSSNREFAAQRALLSQHEMVPNAHTVAYLTAIHFQLRGEKLFAVDAVRCRDVMPGQHSRVGFSTEMISVSAVGDSIVAPFLGLASEECCDPFVHP